MYNPNSNANHRYAPDADTPPLGVFYQRRTNVNRQGQQAHSAFSISAAPTPKRRLERPAADDAVVNTPHWG